MLTVQCRFRDGLVVFEKLFLAETPILSMPDLPGHFHEVMLVVERDVEIVYDMYLNSKSTLMYGSLNVGRSFFDEVNTSF